MIKQSLILLCESALQVHDNKMVDNPLKPMKMIFYNQTNETNILSNTIHYALCILWIKIKRFKKSGVAW